MENRIFAYFTTLFLFCFFGKRVDKSIEKKWIVVKSGGKRRRKLKLVDQTSFPLGFTTLFHMAQPVEKWKNNVFFGEKPGFSTGVAHLPTHILISLHYKDFLIFFHLESIGITVDFHRFSTSVEKCVENC